VSTPLTIITCPLVAFAHWPSPNAIQVSETHLKS
jgi:hypothetical protein